MVSIPAAENVESSGEVIGVDISQKMVDEVSLSPQNEHNAYKCQAFKHLKCFQSLEMDLRTSS